MVVNRGIIWPILLIALGVAFLLSNFGYIPALDIGRAIAVLWPLVLVMVGIDLAVGRRNPSAALALQLLAVAVGIGVLAARPDVARFPGSNGFGGSASRSVTVERGSAQSASVRMQVGGGRLELAGGATALVEATSDAGDLRERVTRGATSADVRLEQQHFTAFGGSRNVLVRLASDVPMSVRLESGAGEFRLDLRDVKTTDVRVETGASTLRLVLPRPTGDVPVRIDAGAATIEIEVPEGVEAQVTAQGALMSVNGRTETPGYAAARDRVSVRIQAGASSINIR
ncbi:MAG TPA: DUF5668 domain-containing protein [Candidatus Limnocylindria bacterium]|nr:DUF5668 domain-containing protein [Candidatus Limnocylindria bacterium]